VEYNTANNWIKGAYSYFEALGEARIRLIDTHTAIGHHQNGGGVHLTDEGNACWYQALLDYAAENGIPQ
jgi:hypothetical protein